MHSVLKFHDDVGCCVPFLNLFARQLKGTFNLETLIFQFWKSLLMYYFDNLLPVDREQIIYLSGSLIFPFRNCKINLIVFQFFLTFFSILLFVILFSWGFLHDSLLKEGIHDECGCVCVYKIHNA